MEGKGFEVVVKDRNGKVVIDRTVNTIADGEGWAREYTQGMFGEGRSSTLYVDGKPRVTYHPRKSGR